MANTKSRTTPSPKILGKKKKNEQEKVGSDRVRVNSDRQSNASVNRGILKEDLSEI